ncbi:MAG: nitrogenase-associated protein [Methylomonas sp.]|nr:MAG: nitrogenase-associated protein [Methylomonas sp.]
MATVHFYEKPGCLNNAKQKRLLVEAGHLLIVHDLLQQPWEENSTMLRSFFGDLPIADWFNRAAPAVKSGEVVPEEVDEQQAIALMIAQPLLIRRPLMEVDGNRQVGFDADTIAAWLEVAVATDLETCPKQHQQQACGS